MLNSTYGAGYRCGFSPRQTLIEFKNGEKVLEDKQRRCPFPKRRFVSRFLWLAGCEAGIYQRLVKQTKKGI